MFLQLGTMGIMAQLEKLGYHSNDHKNSSTLLLAFLGFLTLGVLAVILLVRRIAAAAYQIHGPAEKPDKEQQFADLCKQLENRYTAGTLIGLTLSWLVTDFCSFLHMRG